jgi:DNA-binding XRE family transcriptional regulator
MSTRQKNLGAQFFFQLSLFSFLADVIGIISNFTKFNTDLIFNLYQISEVVILTLLAIELGNFNKNLRIALLIACALQVIFFFSIFQPNNFEVLQDYISGVTKLYILTILFISATRYILNARSIEKNNIAPLVGILGIFIYEALSIIPTISLHLQRLFHNPQQITVIYLIFMMSGNLIRDILVSYNAILNLKKMA